VKGLNQAYKTHGHLQIREFLSKDSVTALYDELRESGEWRLTANRGQEIHHFDLDQVAKWTREQHQLLDKAVNLGGRYNFQFRYEVIRLDDRSEGALAEFRDFMSSDVMVDIMRKITGADDISFADAHASRYQPGHFLTVHDDQMDTMGRRTAYVLNLTPEWRPDWGGFLQFFDKRGDVACAFAPRFNVLNLFAVPKPHNVSWVTPLAAAPRYAVTGWLRAPQ
jgi:Rps23 Pro-64 3,4-dihydroxylase Tpa1-like proline 4-hydroxylase